MIAEHTSLNPQEVILTSYDFASCKPLIVFAEVDLLASFTLNAHLFFLPLFSRTELQMIAQ